MVQVEMLVQQLHLVLPEPGVVFATRQPVLKDATVLMQPQ
jgi:hypothetical protein